MAGKPLKLWTRRHTLETRLRLALGQTCLQVAEAIGFAHSTVKKRAAREDEMCWCGAAGFTGSPDRVDALVWAVTALMLEDGQGPRVRGF